MLRIFAVICILISGSMFIWVYNDMANNCVEYASIYSTLEQTITLTKLGASCISVIILSLILFKERRCY